MSSSAILASLTPGVAAFWGPGARTLPQPPFPAQPALAGSPPRFHPTPSVCQGGLGRSTASHSCFPPFPASPSCRSLTIASLIPAPRPPHPGGTGATGGSRPPQNPSSGSAGSPGSWGLGAPWLTPGWGAPLGVPPALVGLGRPRTPPFPRSRACGWAAVPGILAGGSGMPELLGLGGLPPPGTRGNGGVRLSRDHRGSLGAPPAVAPPVPVGFGVWGQDPPEL